MTSDDGMTRITDLDSLIKDVADWGYARGLHDTTDIRPQLIKLTEELGEVAAGVARNDNDRIIDGVGDMLVVLIQFGAVFARKIIVEEDVDPLDEDTFTNNFIQMCLLHAWQEIKDRQGQTRDGVFVKEADQ